MKRANPGGFLSVLAFAFLHSHVGYATIINVNNPGFEQPANAGAITGNFGTVTQQLGSGPWSASSSGVPTLMGPRLEIDAGITGGTDGAATISGLGSVNVGMEIMNAGEFFQVLTGVPLQVSTPYRLSVDIAAGSTLSLAMLRNSGIGIGVGTPLIPGLFKSTTAPVGAVTLVSAGMTGRLTFEFTTPAIVGPGDARLRLYGGDLEGVTMVNAVPSVTFDNVLFEIVPEPSSAALVLAGCFGLARRRR
jgi:hypothetical protein